jgi:hypothetical protein
VDFADGNVVDHAMNHTITGNATTAPSNVAMNDELGKYTAQIGKTASNAWLVDWADDDYAKTGDGLTMESVFFVNAVNNETDIFFNGEGVGTGLLINDGGDKETLEFWVSAGVSGSGYTKVRAIGALTPGQWHHAVGVYDGVQEASLYLDGELVGVSAASGPIAIPAYARKYVIGGDIAGANGVEYPLDGAISTARIYSEPLNAQQVAILANRELSSIDKTAPIIRTDGELPDYVVAAEGAVLPAIKAADNSSVVTLTLKADGVIPASAASGIQTMAEGDIIIPLLQEQTIPNAEALSMTFGASELQMALQMGVSEIILTLKASDPAGNEAEQVYNIALLSEPPEDTDDPEDQDEPEDPALPEDYNAYTAIIGTEEALRGQALHYTLRLDTDDNKASIMDIEFLYDSDKLRFESAALAPGGFAGLSHQDGQDRNGNTEEGVLFVSLVKNNGGVSAQDLTDVLNLTFIALAPGEAKIEARRIDAGGYDAQNTPIDIYAALSEAKTYIFHEYDFNADGKVSYADIAALQLHFGKTNTSTDWETISRMDIAGGGNGEIGIEDLMQILVYARVNI